MNIKFFNDNKNIIILFMFTILWSNSSFAGTGGDEFNDLYTQLMGWVQGTLGKVVAVSMILVGIIAGVARQSIMAFAIGIAAGLGLFYTPSIIDKTMTFDITQSAINYDQLLECLNVINN